MKYNIAVLRGGPSSEYDVSLRTGKAVIEALKVKHRVTDVTIDTSGVWHVNGVAVDPVKALQNIDVVFNAMHGEYGEDGKVQQFLEKMQIPYTGSGSLASALAMHKGRTKEVYRREGLRTPQAFVATKVDDVATQARDIFHALTLPVILKPINKGSSVGISVAHSYETLVQSLIALYEHVDTILVEEYIQGKEATVGVIEKFRDQAHYPLIPVEIQLPKEKLFFDHECKYTDGTQKMCPGSFTKEESRLLQEAAVKAHKALGLRHYSRTDFIVHPRRGVYVIETNALPGLTPTSLLPHALEAIGSSYEEFLDHVITITLHK